MMDILNALIGDTVEQSEEINKFCTAIREYLPNSCFSFVLNRDEFISLEGELCLPDEVRDRLLDEAVKENSMVRSNIPDNGFAYAILIEELTSVLIFTLPPHDADSSAMPLCPDTIMLRIRLFFSQKEIFQEQEYRIVQKKQLNRKIKALEKSYMEILEDNFHKHKLIQKKQEDYSETLKKEIACQTEKLRKINARLEESGQLKQKILDNAATAIFTVDIKGYITSVNREFCIITGFDKNDIIGNNSSILGNDFAHRTLDEKVVKQDCRIRAKTGQELIIIRNADTIFNDSGEIIGAVESFIDITNLIKARESAEVARDKLAATCKDLIRKQRDLNDDLKAAAEIQKSLLPKSSLIFEVGDVAWKFIPCQRVGGDIFNIFQLDDNCWGMYMLDVSGHGVPSAMVSVSASQMLQPQTGSCLKKSKRDFPYYELATPSEVLTALDREYPLDRFEKYFTIIYFILDIRNGYLTYCNAAHPYPVVMHKDGTFEVLKEGGTIIGMGNILPFEDGERQLLPGDKLFIYTDGIIEYQDKKGAFYGKDRFYEELQKLKDEPITTIIEGIMDSMMVFGDNIEPQDDISLLGLEFKGKITD